MLCVSVRKFIIRYGLASSVVRHTPSAMPVPDGFFLALPCCVKTFFYFFYATNCYIPLLLLLLHIIPSNHHFIENT